ncbi:MAG: ribosome-associated translation inhibitor RaiA [Candidatus Omnitrophota bacterium]
MQLTITARHFDVTDAINKHIREKIQKLDKYALKILQAHVILDIQKYRHIAEITISAKKLKLTATSNAGDMYSAIDQMIHNLLKQLRRHKDKIKNHPHRRNHATLPDQINLNVPYSKTALVHLEADIRPMSVPDAIAELKSIKERFIVFYNVHTEHTNIACKRNDGKYGIIEI